VHNKWAREKEREREKNSNALIQCLLIVVLIVGSADGGAFII
jgi:hypothetical protein